MNNGAALLALTSSDLVPFLAPSSSGESSSEAMSPYDVATTLRALVQQDGTDEAKFLFVAFEALNRAFFGGQLPPATLLWTTPSSPRAYADHIPTDEHGIRFRIRVSPSIKKYGARFVLDVVLHEMVHTACAHLDGDSELGYKGHGPKFAARCNAIGALLGLAEVSAKGRGGKPDCAQWPLNVRPLGFYGENDPRAAKTKSPGQNDETKEGSKEQVTARAARLEHAIDQAIRLIDAGDVATARTILQDTRQT